MSELAILGGKPAVTVENPERWKRPIDEEKEEVCRLIEQGFLSGSGTGLPKEFEDEFRKYIGCNFCLTVDHGSTALASAFYAVKVGPGDEVITPTLGYIGTYCGALHLGARPVFCDIDPDTLLIDPQDVERRITPRTRAIIPIHFWGNVCDMDALMDIGRRYGIAVVEDAAHAHGAEWDGVKIGNIGDVTCFSLQGTMPGGKPVCGGEGGIATTNVREFYERMLAYCHLHRAGVTEELTLPEYRGLDSEVLGLKWRAHPLALALAKVSLRSLDYRNGRRDEFRRKLFEALNEIPGVKPVRSYPKAKPAGFYGGLKMIYQPEDLDGLPVERYVEALRAEGVPISRYGRSLEHQRMIFRKGFDLWGHGRGPLGGEFLGLPPFKGYREGDFPVAESLIGRILSIPAYIEPEEGFLEGVIEAFEKVAANYKRL
ncbi:TPA: DegT/DnrJ/EryC1/StrS family aminotransferase [Candidatus Poribacteria bacterium]|nr:DegT/DnrJ/EryC1/StrS family aminotransferase [Candidatus Poribacteria bacterium]HEX30063.1 DegT/DnrJ/EryC1/StrS family aminotransferase [Candidatus Poribacteria bacterium]